VFQIAAMKPEPKELLLTDAQSTLPRSDEEIENSGTAFLDVIGKSLGLRYVPLLFRRGMV
jgi:hypothetical protein